MTTAAPRGTVEEPRAHRSGMATAGHTRRRRISADPTVAPERTALRFFVWVPGPPPTAVFADRPHRLGDGA
jgi:hypothetical protein